LTQTMDPAATVVTVTGTPSTTPYGSPVHSTRQLRRGPVVRRPVTSSRTVRRSSPWSPSSRAPRATPPLTVGSHTIVAEYGGDVNHNAASNYGAWRTPRIPDERWLTYQSVCVRSIGDVHGQCDGRRWRRPAR
jgi:hypothetical protein